MKQLLIKLLHYLTYDKRLIKFDNYVKEQKEKGLDTKYLTIEEYREFIYIFYLYFDTSKDFKIKQAADYTNDGVFRGIIIESYLYKGIAFKYSIGMFYNIDKLQSNQKYMKYKLFYSKELYNKYKSDKNSIVVNDEYLYYFDNLIYNKDSNGVVDITKFDK